MGEIEEEKRRQSDLETGGGGEGEKMRRCEREKGRKFEGQNLAVVSLTINFQLVVLITNDSIVTLVTSKIL